MNLICTVMLNFSENFRAKNEKLNLPDLHYLFQITENVITWLNHIDIEINFRCRNLFVFSESCCWCTPQYQSHNIVEFLEHEEKLNFISLQIFYSRFVFIICELYSPRGNFLVALEFSLPFYPILIRGYPSSCVIPDSREVFCFISVWWNLTNSHDCNPLI